jgi:hypothetical protein
VDRWVQAHQILMNWNETQATDTLRLTNTYWNKRYVGLNDIDAKSGYESKLLFQQNQYPVWKSWDLTALTQKWVNGTATNYGVVLWATNETTNGYDLRFHSSDAPPPNNANPPVLEVTYSTDAATKTVYFLKDHLGSIRATVLDSATARVIGYDDYDPWGYPLAQRTKPIPDAYLQRASKYKFTGKEYDDEFGVNWLHLHFIFGHLHRQLRLEDLAFMMMLEDSRQMLDKIRPYKENFIDVGKKYPATLSCIVYIYGQDRPSLGFESDYQTAARPQLQTQGLAYGCAQGFKNVFTTLAIFSASLISR